MQLIQPCSLVPFQTWREDSEHIVVQTTEVCISRGWIYGSRSWTDIVSHVIAFASPQINKENGMMEASRIMNLYQFTQLYRDVTSQAAEVLSAEGATKGPVPLLPSTDSCQASMWMGRYTHE